MTDRGTIGLQWRTKYWKYLIKINISTLAQSIYKLQFLNIIKLFLDTPVQDKHEDFINISDS